MNFAVNKAFVGLCIIFVLLTAALAQSSSTSSCECVECPPDEIAVCRYDSGRCKGKCVRMKTSLTPKRFSAELLTVVLGRKVSSLDLTASPKKYSRIIDDLLDSKGQPVKIEFNGKTIEVGVGLKDSSEDSLRTASKQLRFGSTLNTNRARGLNENSLESNNLRGSVYHVKNDRTQ